MVDKMEVRTRRSKIWEFLLCVHVDCLTCTKYNTIHGTGMWKGKNRDGSFQF